jgi:NAD(P)-dependent dehydrogenase (short-subunit alcohol dehydrogenase family)
MAKFGMSMCVMGMAAEFKQYGIAVNALWPKTAIDTAAMAMIRMRRFDKPINTVSWNGGRSIQAAQS